MRSKRNICSTRGDTAEKLRLQTSMLTVEELDISRGGSIRSDPGAGLWDLTHNRSVRSDPWQTSCILSMQENILWIRCILCGLRGWCRALWNRCTILQLVGHFCRIRVTQFRDTPIQTFSSLKTWKMKNCDNSLLFGVLCRIFVKAS